MAWECAAFVSIHGALAPRGKERDHAHPEDYLALKRWGDKQARGDF